ncbi:MAG: hypothetical protein Q9183_001858, partial [Haloplaca sp. 2 TL-2023]
QYRRVAHYNITHRRRQAFYALPWNEWQLLAGPPFNFLSTLDLVDDAIDSNADIAMLILNTGLESFGIGKDPPEGTPEWRGWATPGDMDKARSTIRQFYRDWSDEGAIERQTSYDPVLRDVSVAFAEQADRGNIKILVPGAGLGRLVFELCVQGYDVEGNEISYHQLLASNWILNHTEKASQHGLFPFAYDFSNTISRSHQLQAVRIPDVHPATALAAAGARSQKPISERMNMTAADFSELYADEKYKDTFNAVATVFFVDTEVSVMKYIRTVRHCLKVDGIWANHGPLLWHWPDREPLQKQESSAYTDAPAASGNGNPGGVELSVEEVILLVLSMGFEMVHQEIRNGTSGYIQNPESMLQHQYRTSHWVARKLA